MAAHVAMNTTIAAATAGLTVFVLRLVMTKGPVGGLEVKWRVIFASEYGLKGYS